MYVFSTLLLICSRWCCSTWTQGSRRRGGSQPSTQTGRLGILVCKPTPGPPRSGPGACPSLPGLPQSSPAPATAGLCTGCALGLEQPLTPLLACPLQQATKEGHWKAQAPDSLPGFCRFHVRKCGQQRDFPPGAPRPTFLALRFFHSTHHMFLFVACPHPLHHPGHRSSPSSRQAGALSAESPGPGIKWTPEHLLND